MNEACSIRNVSKTTICDHQKPGSTLIGIITKKSLLFGIMLRRKQNISRLEWASLGQSNTCTQSKSDKNKNQQYKYQ